LCATSLFAEPLPQQKVPDSLKPWIDWVLHGEEEQTCPLIYNKLSQKLCSWPSELKLEFNSKDALFSQKWEVYSKDIWVKLPGNNKFWPDKVKVNDKEYLVGKRGGSPAIFIKSPGKYAVTGIFYFDNRPEWIQIPAQSGLVGLAVLGNKIAFPRLDKNGRLWLKHGREELDSKKRENRCDVQVHRLIKDSIPLQVVTNLDLYISGKHRNVNIGNIGMKDFIPVKIVSRLPVKIEQNGSLLVQAKPGKWQIQITLRHKGIAKTLSRALTGNFNTDKEIWSFEPHHYLRIVDVSGPAQIDPQQTTMPGAWKSFPAYLMLPEGVMKFEEKKRGDPQPAPDKLNLKRTLWLDFDGKGYSVKDNISGTMTTGWRLNINKPVEPGRIVLNGKEQFITKLDDSGIAGIEMRFGNVNMIAESRINKTGLIPVGGWDRDFHSVAGEIHLPPGWSLFDASGIDNIRETWLKSWTLLDLFLVLIISLVIARLISWKWGILSLIVLALIQHESGAPCWVWLHILAALALLKVVPKGKIYSLINNYRLVCIACLIVISLPFMVNQIKHGIYPQLEYSWRAMDRTLGQKSQRHTQTAAPAEVKSFAQPAAPVKRSFDKEGMKTEMPGGKVAMDMIQQKTSYSESMQAKAIKIGVNEFDSNARIQTGYGMPTWDWRAIKFSWNGPVKMDETMKFVFLSPKINMLLGFVRVILLGLLIYGIAGVKFSKEKGFDYSNIKPSTIGVIFLIMFCMFSAMPANAESSFPSDRLLNQLKIKLTEKEQPDCAPNCAVSPRMKMEIDKDQLKIAMEVHSLYKSLAIPLPGKAQHWLPGTVLLNGKSVSSLFRDPETGYFWIRVPKGIHTIKLAGILPPRNTVQIPFLLKPNYVDVTLKDWNVDGLHENGVVDNQLQFTRISVEKNKTETFESDLLPQFVEITRVFHLGLTWKIETLVQRKTPVGAAIVLQIPLLKGESITSDIPVKNGNVLLNLGPKQIRARWVSSLAKDDQLILKAADTLDWTEIWKVNLGTMWHSDIKGIPVIHHQDQAGRWLPEFRPWPGEEVIINISRPKGVKGQTYTIENSVLELSPGKRITNAQLELNIRSSRGSRHTITLPPNSKLQSLLINDRSQPLSQTGDKVILPLVPGLQKIKLTWRTSKEIGLKWKASEVDLGIASVDSYCFVKMPQNRWILFCAGPYVGPAVLFWSSVLVLLLLSFGLGRLKITPLKSYHWFLLGLGLTQASLLAVLPVAAWLIALGLRMQNGKKLSDAAFNFIQIVLPALTFLAVVVLFYGIQNGLLGYPNMQITGNGSYNHLLKWYQDISGNILPQPVVFSLPMTIYRVLILAWALWIAFALIKWLRWGWECYSADGLWRKVELRKFKKPAKKKEDQITLDLPDKE
ncbi:MAG: hypothetical protein KAR45_14715, partial [Desulfobacteraceae bacterium]|nr:hypothetical protein [Desulfobacteraceae bacterium]